MNRTRVAGVEGKIKEYRERGGLGNHAKIVVEWGYRITSSF